MKGFFVEYENQSTTHMNFKTVKKEQMTLVSNNTDKGKYDSQRINEVNHHLICNLYLPVCIKSANFKNKSR